MQYKHRFILLKKNITFDTFDDELKNLISNEVKYDSPLMCQVKQFITTK
jgi:hypothetical protein